MPRDDAKENVVVVDADVRANAKALNAARANAVALATELGATVERNQTLERLARELRRRNEELERSNATLVKTIDEEFVIVRERAEAQDAMRERAVSELALYEERQKSFGGELRDARAARGADDGSDGEDGGAVRREGEDNGRAPARSGAGAGGGARGDCEATRTRNRADDGVEDVRRQSLNEFREAVKTNESTYEGLARGDWHGRGTKRSRLRRRSWRRS